jgi:hypothetical protein
LKIWIKGMAIAATAAVALMSGAAAKTPVKHSTAVVGQPGAGPGANPLNLTPTQQKQMQAIAQKMMPDLQKAMSEQDPAKRQKLMAASQAKWRPVVMKILTPVQRKKAAAMEAQAKAKMRESRKAMMKQSPASKPAR